MCSMLPWQRVGTLAGGVLNRDIITVMENFGKCEFTNFDGKKWKKVGVSGKLTHTLKIEFVKQ